MSAMFRGSDDHIMAVSPFMIIARKYKVVWPIFTSNSSLTFMNGSNTWFDQHHSIQCNRYYN